MIVTIDTPVFTNNKRNTKSTTVNREQNHNYNDNIMGGGALKNTNNIKYTKQSNNNNIYV